MFVRSIRIGALILLPVMLVAHSGFAQKNAEDSVSQRELAPAPEYYQPSGPEVTGGLKAVEDSISYPVEAKKERIEGTVLLNFVVDKEGTVQNLEIMRGVHPLLDREALRVIRSLEFKAKTKNGEAVSSHMNLPVKFSLDSLKSQ